MWWVFAYCLCIDSVFSNRSRFILLISLCVCLIDASLSYASLYLSASVLFYTDHSTVVRIANGSLCCCMYVLTSKFLILFFHIRVYVMIVFFVRQSLVRFETSDNNSIFTSVASNSCCV